MFCLLLSIIATFHNSGESSVPSDSGASPENLQNKRMLYINHDLITLFLTSSSTIWRTSSSEIVLIKEILLPTPFKDVPV